MNKNTSEFQLMSKLFFRLLPYHVLLIVISAVNGIVDSIYASNVIGVDAMSAIGLFGPMNHFLYAAAMMLVSGSQVLYGRFLATDRKRINSLFSVNLAVSLGISVLISLLLVLGVFTGATRVLVSKEPILGMLNDYILGQAIGIPALILGQQLFAFLSMENQTKRTMIASIACFLVNALLDHLCVYTLRMGNFGLGLGSSLAAWVFLAVQAVYYFKGRSEWKFSLRGCRWHDSADIVRLGYSGALSRFVEMFRCLIVNFLVLRYVGSEGISAFAASNSLLAVVWAVPFGMMAVCRMLFSVSIGEQDRRSLRDAMSIGLRYGILIMAGFAALLVLLAEPLTRLFYQDPSDPVYMMTVMGFRILPLCMPLAVFSLNFAAYAQTMEKKVMSNVLPVIDGMVGVVLFSFILIPSLKMNGLYIANVLNGILCFLVVLLMAWQSGKRFPRGLEGLMDMPADFGVPPEDRIDISVSSMEEIVSVSGQIIEFCERQQIDSRRAHFAGLCLEEMAGNVITHGFAADGKDHSIDLRVVRSGDRIILRMRDNCTAFNPRQREESWQMDDSGKNIGIHLVFRIAESVEYQQLLGLNSLKIVI